MFEPASTHPLPQHPQLQFNLYSLNTDGLFTMAYTNTFLSPYEILPIAEKKKKKKKKKNSQFS